MVQVRMNFRRICYFVSLFSPIFICRTLKYSCTDVTGESVYSLLLGDFISNLMACSHRRRGLDETVLSCRVGGVSKP